MVPDAYYKDIYSINYDNFPPIIHYMGHAYMGGMIQGSNGINITQAQYDALSTADKMNGKIYMIMGHGNHNGKSPNHCVIYSLTHKEQIADIDLSKGKYKNSIV